MRSKVGVVGTLCITACAAFFGAAQAATEGFNDGSLGMTCHFYAKVAKLPWRKQGGDWTDAYDEPFGGSAFASGLVRLQGGNQTVSLDVTRLAATWVDKDPSAGTIFLRVMPGKGGGIVNFFSRESTNRALRPLLILDFDDGSVTRLEPTADTYFACPTYGSTGGQNVIKVGGGHNAILVFPLRAVQGKRIRQATLQLASGKQYGRGAEVGVFRPLIPGVQMGLLEEGIATHYRGDSGVEKDPKVIFVERFDSARWGRSWSGATVGDSATIVKDDPENSFQALDGDALRVTIPQGKNQGLNVHYRFASEPGGEPDEAYFRYYIRLAPNWNPSIDGGKLPGLSGTYGKGGWGMRKSDGRNGWSARGHFFKQDKSGNPMRGIGAYLYHAGMTSPSGDTFGWGMLEKGRWYSVEQHVRLNTPGTADGMLRGWIDGRLVFEHKRVRFRDVPELKIESVWLNVYHGGMRPAPHDMTLFIDNVIVAREYIGPMAPP